MIRLIYSNLVAPLFIFVVFVQKKEVLSCLSNSGYEEDSNDNGHDRSR